MDHYERKVTEALRCAGIRVVDSYTKSTDPNTDLLDIAVHDNRFFKEVVTKGSLALGNLYCDGVWDCDDLSELFHRLLQYRVYEDVVNWRMLLSYTPWAVKMLVTRPGHEKRSHEVGEHHYDVGNDLYRLMLSEGMMYTCAYWDNGAKTLDEAQKAKLRLVFDKLGLRSGMRVLDIGCGWGGALKFAAEQYGVRGVGVTISKEQAECGRKACKSLPVDIRLCDYRNVVDGLFDRIFSLGMFEHVGPRYYRVYMEKARTLLKPDGLFLLHTITNNETALLTDPWIWDKIFPGGHLPSLGQISRAAEGLFVVEDVHNFGYSYYKTLLAWEKNFRENWDVICKSRTGYDEYFYRMWRYYLLSCAGAYKARHINLHQFVLSPNGVREGYVSIR
ncbi:MAG: cyclopropane fatty acyl phospholipid synthase [Candidatus Yonathbacteria bacterium]|nr:cyclopropane fatty acyl phospholipid synthase [Candidatus Yonathbacteria bacterium]